MKFKVLAILLSCLMAVSVFGGCGGSASDNGGSNTPASEADGGSSGGNGGSSGGNGGSSEDFNYTGNESKISVDTYQGGFGSEFLSVVARKFEIANAEKVYANGKKGVKIVVTENMNNNGANFKNNVKNATSDVHVVEGMYYTDLLQDGSILDISDVVTAELSDGTTIESKLNTEQQKVLKSGGKYYSIPTFAGFSGLTYNKQLFTDNDLYFSNYLTPPDTISSYTGLQYTGRPLVGSKTETKSPGPDGILNTEDDGLPSSYEEFFYLLDTMLELNIIPFISYTGHYTNYLFQELLCAASTANGLNAMFTFDSNAEQVNYISGWSGNTPTTTKNVITQSNGYLSTKEYSRYQALKFIKHLATYEDIGGHSYIHPDTWKANVSNTTIQRMFLNSTIDPNADPIAMINEGVYWYNEAKGTRTSLGPKANNMDLGYMTLPAKETGTVRTNQGTAQLVADVFYYYLVVNANIAGDAEKLAIAKDFIKFMYTDEMLQLMTVTTGIPFALDYDLEDEQYESMDKLSQSFWNIYSAAKDDDAYITCISTSPIFIANTERFSFKTSYSFFKSKVRGSEANQPPLIYFHLNTDVTAKEYFEGMSIDKTAWDSTYNK